MEMANLSRSQVSRYLDRKMRQQMIAKKKDVKKV